MVQENIHLFVFDTLSDWEIGYAVAGINNPAFQSCPGKYRVRYPAAVLKAWYRLFKTGDPAYYEALIRSVPTVS